MLGATRRKGRFKYILATSDEVVECYKDCIWTKEIRNGAEGDCKRDDEDCTGFMGYGRTSQGRVAMSDRILRKMRSGSAGSVGRALSGAASGAQRPARWTIS